MAASLEVRLPLLDRRVVEFVWVLPPAVRFRGRRASKRLRRGILYKRLIPDVPGAQYVDDIGASTW